MRTENQSVHTSPLCGRKTAWQERSTSCTVHPPVGVNFFPNLSEIPSAFSRAHVLQATGVEKGTLETNLAHLECLEKLSQRMNMPTQFFDFKESTFDVIEKMENNILGYITAQGLGGDTRIVQGEYIENKFGTFDSVYCLSLESIQDKFKDDTNTLDAIILTIAYILKKDIMPCTFNVIPLIEEFIEYYKELSDGDEDIDTTFFDIEIKELQDCYDKFALYDSCEHIKNLFYSKQIEKSIYEICSLLIKSSDKIDPISCYTEDEDDEQFDLFWITKNIISGNDSIEGLYIGDHVEYINNNLYDNSVRIKLFTEHTPHQTIHDVEESKKAVLTFIENLKKLTLLCEG